MGRHCNLFATRLRHRGTAFEDLLGILPRKIPRFVPQVDWAESIAKYTVRFRRRSAVNLRGRRRVNHEKETVKGLKIHSKRWNDPDPGGSTPELSGRIGISDQDHPDQPAVANGCDLSAGQELGLVLSDLGPG